MVETLYMFCCNYQQKNQKVSKCLGQECEWWVYWNEYNRNRKKNFAIGLKICALTAWIKKYKLFIIKKKKHDEIVQLGKSKLNTIDTLISKALSNSYISNEELISVSNVLREYKKMKEEMKNPETSVEYII